MEKIYNIIATTNTAYANYLMVLLESIFRTNTDKKLRLFVLYNSLTEDEKQTEKYDECNIIPDSNKKEYRQCFPLSPNGFRFPSNPENPRPHPKPKEPNYG